MLSHGLSSIVVIGIGKEAEVLKRVEGAGAKGKGITVLADETGAELLKLGLAKKDGDKVSAVRAAALIDDGTVKMVQTDSPTEFGKTSAFVVIEAMQRAYGEW